MHWFEASEKASEISGRSRFAILVEMLALRFGNAQVGFSEYFDFHLYDKQIGTVGKREFGGWRTQNRLEHLLVDEYSVFQSTDKVTMYAVMAGFGLPFPGVLATYGCPRPAQGAKRLADATALMAFLKQPGNLPIYIKPASSSFGRGNFLVEACTNGQFRLGNGESITGDALTDRLQDRRGLGWILQQPLESHPSIASVSGTPKISGLRIHTFLGKQGPEIFRVVWRVNGGSDDDDHFRFGRSGNLIADVDMETGQVRQVITGFGFSRTFLENHPRTGQRLVGFQIPHWQAIRELVLDAHLAFPGYLCPGWDIAVCAEGPRILEINAFGDIDTSQLASGRGFVDDRLKALLNERGLLRAYEAVPFWQRFMDRGITRSQHRAHWAW